MTDEQLNDPNSRQQARGDAAAARARSKALRPWYRKKRFIVPLALVGLLVVIGISGGGEEQPVASSGTAETPPTAPRSAPARQQAAAVAETGEAARDGDLEFTVEELECGEDALGDQFSRVEAQGQFCILTVRMENIGDQQAFVDLSSQYLLERDGTQHGTSFEAIISDTDNDLASSPQINPGNAVEGQLVFDVPADAQIVSAELHDSPASGGVAVDLR